MKASAARCLGSALLCKKIPPGETVCGMLPDSPAVYTVPPNCPAPRPGQLNSTSSRGLSMAIIDLGNVLKIFGGGAPSPSEREQLVKEVLLMTLARASSSDSNTNPVEVATVQSVLKEVTGEDISAADVRVAAASEIFESAPLEKYLSSVSRTLSPSDRATIARSLARVIRSDTQVSEAEVEYFNRIAAALGATAAELAGLVS